MPFLSSVSQHRKIISSNKNRALIEVETSKANNFLVVLMKFVLVRLIQQTETFLKTDPLLTNVTVGYGFVVV